MGVAGVGVGGAGEGAKAGAGAVWERAALTILAGAAGAVLRHVQLAELQPCEIRLTKRSEFGKTCR